MNTLPSWLPGDALEDDLTSGGGGGDVFDSSLYYTKIVSDGRFVHLFNDERVEGLKTWGPAGAAAWVVPGDSRMHAATGDPGAGQFVAGNSTAGFAFAGPAYAIRTRTGVGGGSYGTGCSLLLDNICDNGSGETTTLAIFARQGPNSHASIAGIYTRVYAGGSGGPTAPGGSFQTSFCQALDIQKFHNDSHITGMEINYYAAHHFEGGAPWVYDAGRRYGDGNMITGQSLIPSAGSVKATVALYIGKQGGITLQNAHYRGIDFGTNSVAPGPYVVNQIVVDNGGAAYTTAPVTIAAAPGGDNALAFATIEAGVVTAITVMRSGSAFTSVPAVTIGGDGVGALAHAVMDRPAAIDTTRVDAPIRLKFDQGLQWYNPGSDLLTTGMFVSGQGDTFVGTNGALYFLRQGAIQGAWSQWGLHIKSGSAVDSTNFGGGNQCIYIADAAVVPTGGPNASGGILYCEGGALKFRGGSGTLTTIGPA